MLDFVRHMLEKSPIYENNEHFLWKISKTFRQTLLTFYVEIPQTEKS